MAQVLYAVQPNVTGNQQLIAQAIADGTYFQWNITPTGTIDGANLTFTLPATPNPAASLRLRLNGRLLKSGAGNDFTLTNGTITMAAAPESGDAFIASFTVSPI